MVLLEMKETAQQYLACQVNKVVVTIPAIYKDSQRRASIDVGKIVGLEVLWILNEWIVVAIAYGLDLDVFSSCNDEDVLILDLDGRNFDVVVLNIKKYEIEVKAVEGDTHLGGEDFDNRIVKYFVEEFERKYKVDISPNERALEDFAVHVKEKRESCIFQWRPSIMIFHVSMKPKICFQVLGEKSLNIYVLIYLKIALKCPTSV